jgi:DeoR/GlpR family transcriptional regulator of sugar metabolism
VGNTNGRAEFILQELLRKGRVSVESLSEQLQVNPSSIRRDLERLEQQKLLRRVHGGAVPADMLTYTAYDRGLTFQENVGQQAEEKARIALAAAHLIGPGDTIAISPGTTTAQLARSIRQITNLTVITNAINVAMELAGLRDITLILTGGLALPDFFALVGPLAEQNLRQMYVDKAFIGVTGLSLENGLTGPNQLEAYTNQVMISRARQTIILADHTKLGRVAPYHIAPISAMHTLVTDTAAPAEVVRALEAPGITVQLA